MERVDGSHQKVLAAVSLIENKVIISCIPLSVSVCS